MKFVEENGVVRSLLKDVTIPKMALVHQSFPRPVVGDVQKRVRELMNMQKISSTIKPGMIIAITCGSRGIANIKEIIREICNCVREKGAIPFIVPSMGSHAGADADGQRQVLYGFGVTEEYCNAEIKSCMNTVCIGKTDDGRNVWIDENASKADGIIVVGRIKAHTDFRGPCESGLMKMMVIGLGKQRGAETFHKDGPKNMAKNLLSFGNAILKNAKILFGIGIIENAYEETAAIEALTASEIPKQEPKLLEYSKSLMPKSFIQDVDVLIIDQVGKDISGDGMDPNITGRYCNPYVSGGMNIGKIAILDLSKNTHGQMVGIGYGDTTTMRCFSKCDFEASYPNALTSTTFTPFRIPMVLPSDFEAIAACIKYSGCSDASRLRVMRIHDTLHMGDIWVSESLLEEVQKNGNMKVLKEPSDMPFDKEGNLKDLITLVGD